MVVSKTPVERVLVEPRLGGRWLEVAEDGTQTIVATITHWEPPHRVVLVWQVNALWQPDASMKSEVDGTIHAGRFGRDAGRVAAPQVRTMGAEGGASMRRDVDGGWPGMLERFVAEAEGRAGAE